MPFLSTNVDKSPHFLEYCTSVLSGLNFHFLMRYNIWTYFRKFYFWYRDRLWIFSDRILDGVDTTGFQSNDDTWKRITDQKSLRQETPR